MSKKSLLHVTQGGELPLALMSAINDVPVPNVLRISGGCKGLNVPEEKVKEYFLIAFAGYKGILFSGGTKAWDEEGNNEKFMITDIPVLIAETNGEGIQVLGTTPRTDQLWLKGDRSEMQLDEYNQQLNSKYDQNTLVQQSVNEVLKWDGDLGLYFKAMEAWKDTHNANTAVLTFNGGQVTYDEGKRALEEGHALIIVKGSGRESERLAEELAGKDNVYIADLSDPQSLRNILQELNFLSEVTA